MTNLEYHLAEASAQVEVLAPAPEEWKFIVLNQTRHATIAQAMAAVQLVEQQKRIADALEVLVGAAAEKGKPKHSDARSPLDP